MSKSNERKFFRFVSFQSFIDMLQREALCFVKPDLWDDPFEAYFFKKIKTKSGIEEIEKIVSQFPNGGTLLSIAMDFERTFYAQSWTFLGESDAMWRIYSYGNFCVRIEVQESNIEKLDDVEILEVEYVPKHDLLEEIERIGINNGKTNCREIYRIKRLAFTHEKEARLIYQYKEGVNQNETPDVFYIDYSKISNFLNSICLHPLAPSWFDNTMRQLCDSKRLNYIGRSKLYDNLEP